MKSIKHIFVLPGFIVLLLLWSIGCTEVQSEDAEQVPSLNIAVIEQVTGMEGTEHEGEYKISVPQNGLDVTVDGFKIIPPMGMGSWAAFSPTGDGAMLMGDLVVKEDEIAEVQQVLIEHGLTITALHNHFVREQPDVMYMHIGGQGPEKELARGVKAVFDKIAELRGGNPAVAKAETVKNTLNTDRLSEILGYEGSMNRGVYKVTIGRPDVELKMETGEHHEEGEEYGEGEENEEGEGNPSHHQISTFMGFSTWAAWQGTPEKAAVAGDFVMLADEVDDVIEALVTNGIEVVALHNHMIHEEPRVFYLHYWGVGKAEKLARGLRAALNQTGVAE